MLLVVRKCLTIKVVIVYNQSGFGYSIDGSIGGQTERDKQIGIKRERDKKSFR